MQQPKGDNAPPWPATLIFACRSYGALIYLSYVSGFCICISVNEKNWCGESMDKISLWVGRKRVISDLINAFLFLFRKNYIFWPLQ